MKQIPNIEETHNTREVEDLEATLQALSFWNVLDTDEQCELRITLHHQLQKARGEDIHFRVTNYGTKKVDEMIAEAVQKARQDWLREEIVRLEGMKHVAQDKDGLLFSETNYNQALQTIIDRYHSELDQDKTNGL